MQVQTIIEKLKRYVENSVQDANEIVVNNKGTQRNWSSAQMTMYTMIQRVLLHFYENNNHLW